MMTTTNTDCIDALLVFPPLYAEHYVGLIDEDLICDSGHPFEYPQGVLSIASYLTSTTGDKRSFKAKVLHLDAHLYSLLTRQDSVAAGTEEIESAACETAERYVREFKPKFVGISVLYYLAEPVALKIAAHLRNVFGNEIVIGLGGQEVSFYDDPSHNPSSNKLLREYDCVDLIVKKGGEYTTQSILESLEGGDGFSNVLGISYLDGGEIHITPDRGADNLLNLVTIDNNLLLLPPEMSLKEFFSLTNVSLVLMRGCAFGKCSFCTSRSWFGPFDRLDNLSISEMDSFMAKCETTLRGLFDLGVKRLQLLDEAINSSNLYFNKICLLLGKLRAEYDFTVLAETRVDLINRNDIELMRSAAIEYLYLGIESGSPKVLRKMNKRIETPLLADSELVGKVKSICPDFCNLAPEIQQIMCSCFLTKSIGIKLGLFFMIGHPGSTAQDEEQSRHLLSLLFESNILDANDVIEMGIFIPLNGTSARNFKEVSLLVEDKRRWGRMSGHAVCELIDDVSHNVIFSKEEIEIAFKRIVDLVQAYQGTQADTNSRWQPVAIPVASN